MPMPLPFLPEWRPLLLALVLAPALALLALELAQVALARLLRGREAPALQALLAHGRMPARLAVALLVLDLMLPAARLEEAAGALADTALGLASMVALGWAATRKLGAAFDARLEAAAPAGDEDLERRRKRTQLIVFRRLALAAGVVMTAGFVLTAIPAVRAVGLSLFASAGVAGIVIGIAARPAVSNLIAGLQLALTQPIRIGDAVQVEGHWGRVQEIGSSFVTIATWDQRSLVVPLSHFVEKPVLNWTRESAQLLDSAVFHLDHTAPVAAIRAQVTALVAELPEWDGRVCTVQVTAVRESCIELRVLLSAADATAMWALRCAVREAVLAWLVREHPHALPRQRQQGV
jgi:small-conductance mechanosensitive channel